MKTKSKFFSVGLIVLLAVVLALSYSDASGGNPFKKILFKLNKIIHLLEEEVIPGINCEPIIGIPQTGQTESYAAGDDGALQMGIAWPNPRFTDNEDGTVTDNLTGLILLKDANCFGQRTWANALTDCNNLGDGDCGLTDGSAPGDWRLPNMRELQSLIHYGVHGPALPNTAGTGHWTEGDPFTDVQDRGSFYWTSTTSAIVNNFVWMIFIEQGYTQVASKTNDFPYVWPVRDGN